MSVCPYYLRGNCRYGNRCRLPHENADQSHRRIQNDPQPRFRPPRPTRAPFNPNYNYVAPHIAARNSDAGNPTASGKQNSQNSPTFTWIVENFKNKTKAVDIIQQMRTEAKVWLKSSLWRFTSRSLFPGGRPLEHWNDQSFEEVRWAYRQMASQAQEHIYKKAYFDYWETTERQLRGLSELRLETLNSLKDYIDQYIASDHKPSKTLLSDIEMKDDYDNIPSNSNMQSTNYTPNDLLLEDELAAFESETFQLGQIPVHAPSRQFC